VDRASEGLAALVSAPPIEFGGPGDRWSPETLLVAAVADCFALTFRAIALASQLAFTRLQCRATGKLERVERVTRFVGIRIGAALALPAGADTEKARRLLEKAEKSCLVSNSLSCPVELEIAIHA
jgi:peroxiredoxin-like protein